MGELDIYAFGHALVDEEYAVSEAFLQTLGIAKSHRTLIDFRRSQTLRDSAIQRGQLNLRSGGGSGANTIATAALLGARCHFSCLLGDDEDGRFYQQQLQQANIGTDRQVLDTQGHTGVCLVMLTPDAARTMNTYVGITDDIGPQHLNLDALKKADWVYIEGHLLIAEAGFQSAMKARDEARRHGKKLAVNFCDPAVARLCRERMAILLSEPVDLLFCNDEEAEIWSYSDDPELQKAQLNKLARQWVITRGENGALVFDGEQENRIDAHEVTAVSTLGAGDTFAGAFMYAVTQGRSFAEAGRLASLASAHLVQQAGPRLTAEQLNAILQHHENG